MSRHRGRLEATATQPVSVPARARRRIRLGATAFALLASACTPGAVATDGDSGVVPRDATRAVSDAGPGGNGPDAGRDGDIEDASSDVDVLDADVGIDVPDVDADIDAPDPDADPDAPGPDADGELDAEAALDAAAPDAGWDAGCEPMGSDDRTCDGVDDDCSGEADEDYVGDDSCGVGYCREHNTPSSCVAGVETACAPGAPPSPPTRLEPPSPLVTPPELRFVEAEDAEQVLLSGDTVTTELRSGARAGIWSGERYLFIELDARTEPKTVSVAFQVPDEAESVAVRLGEGGSATDVEIQLDGAEIPGSPFSMTDQRSGIPMPKEILISNALGAGPHTVTLTATAPRGVRYLIIDGFMHGEHSFRTLRGTLREELYGQPVRSARVDVGHGGGTVFSTMTEDDGSFAVTGLFPDRYLLEASAYKYAVEQRIVSFVDGEEVVEVELSATFGVGLHRPRTIAPEFVRPGDLLPIETKTGPADACWTATLYYPRKADAVLTVPLAIEAGTHGSGELRSTFTGEPMPGWHLSARVPDDAPGVLYELEVTFGGEADSEPNAVRVVDSFSPDFYFVHTTDTHFSTGVTSTQMAPKFVREMNLLNPTMVIVTGDLTDWGHELMFEDVLRGPLAGLSVPLVVAPGNHDTMGGPNTFEPRFTPTDTQCAAMAIWERVMGPSYFRVDYGASHLFVLAIQPWLPLEGAGADDWGLTPGRERPWLEAEIARAAGDPMIVAGHFANLPAQFKTEYFDPYVSLGLWGHSHGLALSDSWSYRADWELGGFVPFSSYAGTWKLTSGTGAADFVLVRVHDGVPEIVGKPDGTAAYEFYMNDGSPQPVLEAAYSDVEELADGTWQQSASLQNDYDGRFERAQLKFEVPPGRNYMVDQGRIASQFFTDDGTTQVVLVEVTAPPVGTTEVTLRSAP